MRTNIVVLSIVIALCGMLVAAERPLEELRAEAAKAEKKEKTNLYVSVAQRQLKLVEDFYGSGDSEKGQAAVNQLATDCADAASASVASRTRMKHTEIALRKIGEKLEDIRRNAAFDDRAPIKEAADRIEKARSSLLDAMFAK